MADIQKPDMSKQWANSGNKTPPADSLINSGWVAGQIPLESDFNYIDARQDQGLAYLLQKGIPEWDSSTEYQANKSYVQYNGKVYKCIQTGVNKQPDTQLAYWWYEQGVSPSRTIMSFNGTGVADGSVMYFAGRDLVGDGGGGTFRYSASSTVPADGGIVFETTDGGRLFREGWTPNGVFRQIDVAWFGVKGGDNDDTLAFQRVADYLKAASAGYSGPYVTVKLSAPYYKIYGSNGVVFEYDFDVMQVRFEADSGTVLIGAGSNFAFKFNSATDPAGAGFRNVFKKIKFVGFGTTVRWHTNNRDQCMLHFVDCESDSNDVFLDTVSYANSRSSMVKFESFVCNNTRVAAKHFTDQMSIKDSWFYAKEGSYDALFELHGDGNVTISDSFLIPHATPLTTPANARWIDFIEDGTTADRSLKTLTLKNVRQSLESVRPLVWTYATVKPSGANQISSITLEDSYFGGTGGNPVVTYKQGYPGSVNLRNCKVFASPKIVAVDAGNTTPPVPSVPDALTSHVIMIDEATRLSQSNSFNAASLVDPALEPFCYDTTTQTSKFKRSIRKNIDYRLPAVAAPGAGSSKVKASIPIFFDSAASVSSRDILSFILVTVSDAYGSIFSNPAYRAVSVSLVTMIGGNNGSTEKKLVVTSLQNAAGGISYGVSAAPTVFFGTGDTGSDTIAAGSSTGVEDNITFVWESATPEVSWAYILPLAGIRENQQDKMQYGVW